MTKNLPDAATGRVFTTPLVGAALSLFLVANATAQFHPHYLEQFSAQAVSVPASGSAGSESAESAGRIDLLIQRWSTDAELDNLRTALQKGDGENLLSVLRAQQRRIGVVLMPGVQAHGARSRTRTPRDLLFAREVQTPSGRQVIAISDRHLGLGESPIENRKSPPSEFDLLDIRFDHVGNGVGKVASATDVVVNAHSNTFELSNFATLPPRLVDVRAVTP